MRLVPEMPDVVIHSRKEFVASAEFDELECQVPDERVVGRRERPAAGAPPPPRHDRPREGSERRW